MVPDDVCTKPARDRRHPVVAARGMRHASRRGELERDLSALVLFQQITGSDVRRLGAIETAAHALGLDGALTS